MTNYESWDDRLAASQVFVGQHEPLDAATGRERVQNLWHVRERHVPIEEVVGFDENADAARALIEAAGGAGARAEPGQAAHLQLFLQRRANLFRAARRTTAFRIVIRPPINADEEVTLAQRHFVRTPRAKENLFRVGPGARAGRRGSGLFARTRGAGGEDGRGQSQQDGSDE